ncbi:MAG: zinc-dependent alcohol dehydrogenase family protein [Gammaproteobacteria bacterium]
MKAAVLEAFREPLVIRDVPDPQAGARGAVIKVEANGICRSDWHGWVGDWPKAFELPHVLGHEMCGVVESAGPEVKGFESGDRVIVPFSGGDGHCPMCQAGLANICDNPVVPGFRSWGGFAEYVAVDHADYNLVALPESMSYVAAAGMGCRFMTAFHGLTARGSVSAGEWVAVFGCGGVGLSAIEIANALGANVIGVDIGDDKLELARKLGAVVTVNSATSNNASREVRELTGGGAHVSVDALGIEATCVGAIKSLRKRGRHVQIGMTNASAAGSLSLPVDLMIDKEIELYGSKGMPPARYDGLLRMVEAGKLDPGRLVTRTVPLEETSNVLVSMNDYGTLGFTVIDRY